MKVKYFVEMFDKITINAECEIKSWGNVYGRKKGEFSLRNAGVDGYGKRCYSGTIEIYKNGKLIKNYCSVYELEKDDEILESEIEDIKINVSHHYQRSSGGNDYYDNYSSLIITII